MIYRSHCIYIFIVGMSSSYLVWIYTKMYYSCILGVFHISNFYSSGKMIFSVTSLNFFRISIFVILNCLTYHIFNIQTWYCVYQSSIPSFTFYYTIFFNWIGNPIILVPFPSPFFRLILLAIINGSPWKNFNAGSMYLFQLVMISASPHLLYTFNSNEILSSFK